MFSHLWGPALPFDMYCGDMTSMSEDHLNINFKNQSERAAVVPVVTMLCMYVIV